jgi:hypothetical protein
MDYKMIVTLKDDLLDSIKLYSLTLVLPIILTIMNIVIVGIIGFETTSGFWMNFKLIWIDYYITGSIVEIDAWRIHLGLLFCSFLFIKLAKNDI